MSMWMMMTSVSDEEARILRQRPEEINGLLGYEPERPGLIGRLFGKKTAPVPTYTHDWGSLDARPSVDLDKDWDLLHTLLTEGGCDSGADTAAGFVWHGGEDVGTIDVGYGPARLLGSEEAAGVLKVLEPVDAAWLRQRWDLALLREMDPYPSVWDDLEPGDEDEWVESVAADVIALRGLFQGAVASGGSIVIWVA